MTETERELREQIYDLTRRIHKLRKSEEKFIPGVSRVNYSGRVFDESEIEALVRSSLDFWITLGPEAKKFEKNFSDYLGVNKTVVCNSGSSANLLAISALCSDKIDNPIRKGDEIITTASTFPTTLAPIIQNNLVPVFVDVELGTYNIDVSKIESAIFKKTRGIVFAHTLGNPADMKKIMDITKRYGLFVIEDSCDALDSRYNGKFVGTFGDVSTFSFYAAHHMTMGEGGAVATNNAKIALAVTSLRDLGRDCFCQTGDKNPNGACNNRFKHKFPGMPNGYDHKYVFSSIGYNLKPLDLQCAIGIEQLKKLPGFTQKRKENFFKLYECLKNYEDRIILPRALPDSDVSLFSFPITIRDNAGFDRTSIINYLEDKNIETRMLFGGNILRQPGFRNIERRIVGSLENTDKILKDTFFLGVYPGLTEEKTSYVCDSLTSFFKGC